MTHRDERNLLQNTTKTVKIFNSNGGSVWFFIGRNSTIKGMYVKKCFLTTHFSKSIMYWNWCPKHKGWWDCYRTPCL